jgi:uncharacterized protein YaaN involved in tellurite resistance
MGYFNVRSFPGSGAGGTGGENRMSQLPMVSVESAALALETVQRHDPEERARIDQLRASLNLGSATSVLNFGNDVEQDMARFTDAILDQVMAKDTGPVHEKLSEIRLVAQGLSVDKLSGTTGLIGRLLFNIRREIAKFTDRFRTARQQIDTIAMQLEDQVQQISYGLTVLDRLFDQNLSRFGDLTLHVEAGKEALDHAHTQLLPQAEASVSQGSDSDRMLAGQQVRDLKASIDRLDRKVLNLEKSRLIALSMMPTIRQAQQTGITLVEELRMAIAHAIPAWKSAMVVHIEQLRHRHGLETLATMRDFTNEQLKAMATQLDSNVDAIHRETERGIADTDAIVATMQSLIGTIDKVDRLEREAAAARQSSRDVLRKAEVEFRASLAQSSHLAA